MNLVKALWALLNGKKLNTATLIAIGIVALQALGIEQTEATKYAEAIAAAIMAVLAVVGYIHRMIKKAQEKKEAAAKEKAEKMVEKTYGSK